MSSPVKLAPRQVRDAAAASDEAHKQIYPTTVEAAPDAPASPDTPAELPAAAPPPQQLQSPPVPSPAPVMAPAADADDYRQKFLTLQGKYNSEVPALQSRLEGLQNVFANLHTEPVTITPVSDPDDEQAERIRTIREEFGDEFVDAIVRQAMNSVQPQLRELQDAVASHNRNIEQAQIGAAQNARATMYDYLYDNIPDWINVNRSEAFHSWLNQLDVFSGQVRQQLLENAYAANSGPRVAAFFLTFLREQTATGAVPTAQPQPGYPAGTPRPGLETFAAPGRAVAATPVASAQQGRIWTRADISKFYDDKRRGQYRNQQQLSDQLELDIIAAGREGRVQG